VRIALGFDPSAGPDVSVALTYDMIAGLVRSIEPGYRATAVWQMRPRAYRAMQRAAAARRDMKWKSKGARRHARRLKSQGQA
jgi:hypothetical protein